MHSETNPSAKTTVLGSRRLPPTEEKVGGLTEQQLLLE